MITARAGRPIEIKAVSAKDPSKDRPIEKTGLNFVDDPMKLATSSEIDLVVELIGGADGVAKELVETSLTYGKSVVTANKALIANHGLELAELAEKHSVLLAFEAAVAGGIPVVKALRESLAGNQLRAVYGILNGTCNYILSEMGKTGAVFDDILKEAQDKGYAEADPGFDIDGVDAAHKLAILAAIAFGMAPQLHTLRTEGIRKITPMDTEYAAKLGYKIKLVACAEKTDNGILQTVEPCLVPEESPLYHVGNVLNAVKLKADLVGSVFLEGPGAGGDATASSVIADIIDVARDVRYYPFGISCKALSADKSLKERPGEHHFYVRLFSNDQAGALADITRVFHGNNISLDIIQQPKHVAGEVSPVILTTHPTTQRAVEAACAAIGALETVVSEPQCLRIIS